MKTLFAGSAMCTARVACADCLGSEPFRTTLSEQFEMPEGCPFGVTPESVGVVALAAQASRFEEEGARLELLAEEQSREPKIAICRACDSAKVHRVLGVELVWCGSPLRASPDGSTCGCLMNVKTLFQLPCPQGKF